MRNIVVSGGTDGMGQALARHYVRTGNAVVVLGRSQEKGAEILAYAQQQGAGERAHFIRVDLSLVSEQRRAVERIGSLFPVVDALVLAAQHYRAERVVTAEGNEHTFALYYLSRYVLGEGLRPQLERAERPVVLNICGPGTTAGQVHWGDLQLADGYKGMKALMQGSRTNDLLGVGFARAHADSKVRYLLYNPVFVATSFSGDYKKGVRPLVSFAKRVAATPVEKGIQPIIKLIDNPPDQPISAWKKLKEIGLGLKTFRPEDADRLRTVTEELLADRSPAS
ncbi:SDR family NAD(P)-dependent oxidoreductase [Streptomyces sp. DSM 44915]|uniref:SDR family NAD(P)-dependent oxidoreductase n=1 Tax=Streptomyces chisholmiae TaxID=3075540 RepID=A0ABU2JM85_9ACTN|nr:SDR family NAD(P)-dependent oxidoreductase [Streptomyces sp. DSM 44915]